MRARAVDLAGNGPTIAEADALLGASRRGRHAEAGAAAAARPFEFRRFDPLAAPMLVPRRADTEGESVEHAVLRSDHDVSAAEYAAATGYAANADRHVAPAKAALQDAELLGCFDAAIGSGDPAADPGRLHRGAARVRSAGRGRRRDGPSGGAAGAALPAGPLAVGTALVGLPGLAAGTVTRVHPDGSVASEPDQLPGLPPRPGVLLLDWGTPQTWWQAQPFRLQVVEGPGHLPGTPRPECSPWRCRKRPG